MDHACTNSRSLSMICFGVAPAGGTTSRVGYFGLGGDREGGRADGVEGV
jgi:hypothetical protein